MLALEHFAEPRTPRRYLMLDKLAPSTDPPGPNYLSVRSPLKKSGHWGGMSSYGNDTEPLRGATSRKGNK